MILISVLLVYKNGQIHARVTINSPASELPNNKSPVKLPESKNKMQHKEPSKVQDKKVFLKSIIKVELSFNTCTSETVGRSIVDTAFVIADGNKIKGRAIPVNTPYTLNASFVFNPYRFNERGMDTASILCKILRRTRLPVTGSDKDNNSIEHI